MGVGAGVSRVETARARQARLAAVSEASYGGASVGCVCKQGGSVCVSVASDTARGSCPRGAVPGSVGRLAASFIPRLCGRNLW